MSFSDNTYDSDWQETKAEVLKTIKQNTTSGNSSSSKIKYSQKFCNKWLSVFDPWLSRCNDEPNKPFCRACQCRLDCNRCHLQRHERTTKHQRNLKILKQKGEVAVQQELSVRRVLTSKPNSKSHKRSTSKQLKNSANDDINLPNISSNSDGVANDFRIDGTTPIENDLHTVDEKLKCEELTSTIGVTIPTTNDSTLSQTKSLEKKKGLRLLMQIQKDKNDLMESFKDLIASAGNTIPQQQSPQQSTQQQQQQHPHLVQKIEKNHVDLFFESVSSCVKALSPKLIAEAKMRVSQIICELELRGLTDGGNTNDARTCTTNVLSNNDATYFVQTTTASSTNNNQCLGHETELKVQQQPQNYETLS